MDRWIARLERTFLGKLAIERLTTFIVGGMALVYLLAMSKPELIGALSLDPHLAFRQPWRFVTYLLIPPERSMWWIVLALYFTWLIGTNLENEWGSFKFNVYYALGAIGTTVAAMVAGRAYGNQYLNMSMFFAFATMFPDYEILLFFILPVRIKWLALLSAALLGFELVQGDLAAKAAIVASFANYFVFFHRDLWGLVARRRLAVRQVARRAQNAQNAQNAPVRATRLCALCGARQDDGADIRVCSCEVCGGPRDLCLEHARNH